MANQIQRQIRIFWSRLLCPHNPRVLNQRNRHWRPRLLISYRRGNLNSFFGKVVLLARRHVNWYSATFYRLTYTAKPHQNVDIFLTLETIVDCMWFDAVLKITVDLSQL